MKTRPPYKINIVKKQLRVDPGRCGKVTEQGLVSTARREVLFRPSSPTMPRGAGISGAGFLLEITQFGIGVVDLQSTVRRKP